MESIKLLIVEDDDIAIKSYKNVIQELNKEYKSIEIRIDEDIKKTLTEAQDALITSDYAAAIIDLKLSSNPLDLESDLEGMEIVKAIHGKHRYPVFIYSGSSGEVDDMEENSFFKKRARTTPFVELLKEIVEIYSTGITKMLGKQGSIDNYLTDIFWKHLANSLEIWSKDANRTPEEKQKILLRYTLLHIQEYLELTDDSTFDTYHPAEIYITPVINTRVSTGDILSEKGTSTQFIVLTPSCDLANKNTETGKERTDEILLAEIIDNSIEPMSGHIAGIKEGTIDDDKKNKQLKKMINNSDAAYFHFLPKYIPIKGGLINFRKLSTIKRSQITGFITESIYNNTDEIEGINASQIESSTNSEKQPIFERVATVNNRFTKDIIARFSNYYSRQGAPGFDSKEVLRTLLQHN
jgi:hypothetical protein